MLWSELYHALALWLENGMKIMARICTLCVSLNTKSRPFAGLMNGRIINYKCRSPSERESEREREISNLNIVVMIVEWRRCYVTQATCQTRFIILPRAQGQLIAVNLPLKPNLNMEIQRWT